MIRLRLAILALVALIAGCYDTPKPNCAFLCGPPGPNQCPEDYQCGGDGRCHLVLENGSLATCETPLPFDVAQIDAPIDVTTPPVDAGPGPDVAPGPDAAAGPDASTPLSTHGGLVSIADISVQDHPELGSGGRITISFTALGGVAPIFDNRDASGAGCAAWVYDISSGQLPQSILDEGDVTITGTTATIPTCSHLPGAGYLCIAGAGVGDGSDAIVDDAGGPGTAGLVDADADYVVSAADVGRYVSINGAGANNGEYPIVGVDTGTNTLVYANPNATSAAFTGTFTVLAGVGPVPTSPEFLANGDVATVTLDPTGGLGDFEAFTAMVDSGDTFSLDGASQTAITSIPLDGSAVTLNCATGSCGSALVTVVSVETTDGVIPPGAPDYYFPDPIDRIGVIQCASFMSSVTIPAGAMQAIQMADPTRVQTGYFRDNLSIQTNADTTNRTNVLVGHGIVGFTSPPPPPPVPDAGVPDAAIPDAAPPDAFVCELPLNVQDDPGATNQDLVISEINPGDYIELYNNTASPIALDSAPHWLCSPFNYAALSTVGAGVTIPAGGYATVSWPGAFTDTNAGGEVILYDSSTFTNDNSIIDFVCWGTNPHGTRKSQAEAAGKWASSGPCVSGSLANGALHRLAGTDGVDAADYDSSSVPDPMNCTP